MTEPSYGEVRRDEGIIRAARAESNPRYGSPVARVGLSILSAVRRARAVRKEVGGNVQSAPAGDAPVAVSDLLPDLFGGATEAARLRARVMHPRGPDAAE